MRNKALFTFWDGADGHLFRAAALAKVLSDAGFEVGFISAKSHISKLRRLPFRPEIFNVENRKALIHKPPYVFPIYSHAFRHAQRLRGLEFDDTGFLIRTVEEELRVIKSFKPTVIINDYRDTIRIAAEIANIPLIGTTITNGNSAGYPLGWWMEPPSDLILPDCRSSFNEVRARYRLPPITDERQSFEGHYNVIPSCESIDPLRVKREQDVYIGLVDRPDGEGRVSAEVEFIARRAKKIVFCNLGEDNSSSAWRFDSVLYPLADLVDATFVVAGDSSKYAATYRAASEKENVFIRPSWGGADYEWIIKNSSAVISHGGNMALVALSYGIPVVFIPRNTESSSAYTVDAYGAGINLKHSQKPLERRPAPDLGAGVEIMGHWESELDASLLKTCLERIFNDPSYSFKAQELAGELNRHSGPEGVLKIVNRL